MVEKNKNNASGLAWVFALTGWMGFTLGPIISMYLVAVGSGPIMMALGSTALVFFAASAYVLTTRKNLNFMTGFLMTGILVAFAAGIANVFLKIPRWPLRLVQYSLSYLLLLLCGKQVPLFTVVNATIFLLLLLYL